MSAPFYNMSQICILICIKGVSNARILLGQRSELSCEGFRLGSTPLLTSCFFHDLHTDTLLCRSGTLNADICMPSVQWDAFLKQLGKTPVGRFCEAPLSEISHPGLQRGYVDIKEDDNTA